MSAQSRGGSTHEEYEHCHSKTKPVENKNRMKMRSLSMPLMERTVLTPFPMMKRARTSLRRT